MAIILVLAVSKNGVIGKNNRLPWRLPNDMQHFKQLTLGKRVFMGRKTWESLPPQLRPLPGRENHVVSRATDLVLPEGVVRHKDLKELIKAHGTIKTDYRIAKRKDFYVIGGQQLYEAVYPYADVIEATMVNKDYEGDAFFRPMSDREYWNQHWETVQFNPQPADAQHDTSYAFARFKRVRRDESTRQTNGRF